MCSVLLYLCSNHKMTTLSIKQLPAEDEYPDLSQHHNHMSKVLTLEMYKKLRERTTSSGCTIDNVIQTGVDNPGKKNTFSISGVRLVHTAGRAA